MKALIMETVEITESKPVARNYSELELRTKEIYISQHRNYTKDKSIFNRFLAFSMQPSSYDLPEGWLAGKTVLDAGCGNSGYFQVAMHRLGAKKVTCMDLGTEWMAALQGVMAEFDVPEDFVEYVDGSTIELPFENESFDFVASNGVIMHLETVALAERALAELSRVTAQGGRMFVYTGIDQPGLVDRYIVPALRKAYAEDDEFRHFIDHIDVGQIAAQIAECCKTASAFDPAITENTALQLAKLFTLDSATFTQNMLQVPVQQGPRLSEAWAKTQLEKNALRNVRRVPGAYWVRNDYRKFLAPLHYRTDLPLPKMFYGNGHVRMVGEK